MSGAGEDFEFPATASIADLNKTKSILSDVINSYQTLGINTSSSSSSSSTTHAGSESTGQSSTSGPHSMPPLSTTTQMVGINVAAEGTIPFKDPRRGGMTPIFRAGGSVLPPLEEIISDPAARSHLNSSGIMATLTTVYKPTSILSAGAFRVTPHGLRIDLSVEEQIRLAVCGFVYQTLPDEYDVVAVFKALLYFELAHKGAQPADHTELMGPMYMAINESYLDSLAAICVKLVRDDVVFSAPDAFDQLTAEYCKARTEAVAKWVLRFPKILAFLYVVITGRISALEPVPVLVKDCDHLGIYLETVCKGKRNLIGERPNIPLYEGSLTSNRRDEEDVNVPEQHLSSESRPQTSTVEVSAGMPRMNLGLNDPVISMTTSPQVFHPPIMTPSTVTASSFTTAPMTLAYELPPLVPTLPLATSFVNVPYEAPPEIPSLPYMVSSAWSPPMSGPYFDPGFTSPMAGAASLAVRPPAALLDAGHPERPPSFRDTTAFRGGMEILVPIMKKFEEMGILGSATTAEVSEMRGMLNDLVVAAHAQLEVSNSIIKRLDTYGVVLQSVLTNMDAQNLQSRVEINRTLLQSQYIPGAPGGGQLTPGQPGVQPVLTPKQMLINKLETMDANEDLNALVQEVKTYLATKPAIAMIAASATPVTMKDLSHRKRLAKVISEH